ncbi:HPr kinase/phosphorylase [Novosphingobium guangzhouense]|uniref:Serine kinase n=1 Tax=Novosphingobium guangzhouense TaxID=1850347 RepID=A0A2K2G1M8_9SPHN|nr:HPr kinase/phosphatase C-terminal domain-containing protein [Novosphingobium guangzhouense]PNU04950.1 serine kinase [Novosphingobium guangzhouense]
MTLPVARQSTCVEIDGRAVLIEGPSGAGKSSLALALIDRGAVLIGDDSVMLDRIDGQLLASPHPRTRGLLEVRNLGLLPFACSTAKPVALLLLLDPAAPRYIEEAEAIMLGGMPIPLIRLHPDGLGLAIKAELALRHYGLQCR